MDKGYLSENIFARQLRCDNFGKIYYNLYNLFGEGVVVERGGGCIR